MIRSRIVIMVCLGLCASLGAQKAASETPEDLFSTANRDFYSRRFAEAKQTLRKLIADNPTDARARYLLVRTLIEENSAGAALGEAEIAITTCGRQALAQVALGDASYRCAKFQQADVAYQEALRLDPANPRAHLGVGRVRLSEFRLKTALQHLRRAMALDPKDPDIAIALASALAPSREQLALEERWADGATFRDPEERVGTKALLSLAKLKSAGRPFVAVSSPQSVSIPLRGVRRHPRLPALAFLLPVSINGGPPRDLLLDTGAHGLVISSRLAGLDGVEGLVPYRLSGLGDQGRIETQLGWAGSVRVGEVELKGGPVIITQQRIGSAWEGIVGADVLSDFLIALDFPNSMARLTRLESADEANPSDRNPNARPGYTPVRLIERKLMVDVTVGGEKASFVLDTGSTETLISQNLAGRVTALTASGRRTQGLSGQTQAAYSTGEITLEFLGAKRRGAGLTALDLSRLSHSMGVEVGGLLGCDAWRRYVLTIDYRNGFVRIE
jgi:tetratricopeptide (TPR) repeat protein